MRITLFHPIEGVGFSAKKLEGSRNLRKLFGESCKIWGLIKSLPHLINDWIMIDAAKTSKEVVDVAGC